MKVIEGGVTSAKGFFASAAAAGIKYTGRDDMALIYTDSPAKIAGTFTKNMVKAAPVLWDQQIVDFSEEVHAVVINSGIANAATGAEGLENCRSTAEAAEVALSVPEGSVCVASTGVIGEQLPIAKIKAQIRTLAAQIDHTPEAGEEAARAIMTTDTKPKQAAVTFTVNGITVTIGGMAKGSGMIHPNMGTMLSFITTDAVISKELLQEALSASVDETYNMVSVDGDTSTNDTVLLLANGEAKNAEICKKDEAYQEFCEALNEVNKMLAMMIAGDGEGATKLITAQVDGAKTREDARIFAKSVITSSLVKTAVYGNDANVGRILCALGYAGPEFDPEDVDIAIQHDADLAILVQDGALLDFDESYASSILKSEEVTILCNLKQGSEYATAWGCDLSYDYVKINADYRS